MRFSRLFGAIFGLLLSISAQAASSGVQQGAVPPVGPPQSVLQLSLSSISGDSPKDLVSALRLVMVLTVLSLAPAVLIMMTSFTRIVVVLSFLRQALGAQQMPPNQLIVGLSLFLSFFVMAPTFKQISQKAIEPLVAEQIDRATAYKNAEAPLREFMFSQTREKDLELFFSLSKESNPKTRADVPT